MDLEIHTIEMTAEELTKQLARAAAMLNGYIYHIRGKGEGEYRAAQYEMTVAQMLAHAESIFTIEALGDRVCDMAGALSMAGAKFREYETHHATKASPDADKAVANAEMAAMCEAALKDDDEDETDT